MTLHTIVIVIKIIIWYTSYSSKLSMLQLQNQNTTRSMFIVAHPDDETMFMVYTIKKSS